MFEIKRDKPMQKGTKKVQLLSYEFSDREISPWGGLRIVQELIEKIGLREKLEELELPRGKSNRSYSPIDMIISFIVGVILGGNRYIHLSMLRYDEVIKKMFGWREVPSQSTFSRYFKRFSWKINDRIFTELSRWYIGFFKGRNVTLDVDSTVIERYGRQEGSEVGYNPRKPGRPSQHPLIAFISEIKVVANGWLRSGDAHSSNGFVNFLEETLRIVGDNINVSLIRGDSGFFSEKCLKFIEDLGKRYIIAAKFTRPLKKIIVEDLGLIWSPIAKGIEVSETIYRGYNWSKSRRLVLIRKDINKYPDASGKEFTLFPNYDTRGKTYRYTIVITNLEISPQLVWELYKKRSDSENRIKELKYDFAITGFSSEKFYATEAAFRFALFTYNLMAMFRMIALRDDKARRMATLYLKCIALGSWISRKGKNYVLKLSVNPERRSWIVGLFENLSSFSPPILISNA